VLARVSDPCSPIARTCRNLREVMRISIVRSPTKSALMIGLAACGADDAPADSDIVDCATVTDVDTYVVGLEHPGKAGVYDFKLMSAEPAPPARPDNTWVLQVNQLNAGVVGAPVEGATLKVTPFMPKHGHGTVIIAEITPLADPGQYRASPVNMWMNGVWEVTVRATVGDQTDSAVYKFCIP